MSIKKIAITAGVLAYIVVGFAAAEFVAGAAYFLINKSFPTDLALDTWSRYWYFYGDDPLQRKHLQVAAVMAGVLVYLVPLMILGSIKNAGRSLHGDARWARTPEIRKAGLFTDKGIIVGKTNGEYLMFEGQQFVMLAAPTRSGKGVAIVMPNLLNYSQSIAILDMKLESFMFTSAFRERHGQKVYLFNPFAEDGKTHRWNPLDAISRTRNFRIGDVLAIGQALYPSSDVKEAFWNDQARNLFLGLTLYLLDTPELPCTLGELLRQSSGKGQPIKDHLTGIMSSRSNGKGALSEECIDALNRFCSTSDNTMASILATFNAPLTIFSNPIVDAATSASDIDLSMVRKQLMTIYIGIEAKRLADASILVNLFFSQLVNLNTSELPAVNPALKYQCLLILDEFTAIGKVAILAKAVSFIAGYNIRLMPIIQSVSQLESVYGEKDTRTFVTNHALQILYPPREQKDANEYSEMLGFFTEKSTSNGTSRPRGSLGGGAHPTVSENVSDQRRALMLPQELKELEQDKEIIVLENTKPILCEKARYFSDDVFLDRLRAVSPTLRALGKKTPPTQQQLEHVAFVLGELSCVVPTLDVDLHKARMENRVRPAKAGEAIDLAKLATDVDSLPTFADQANPTAAEVEGLVDAFFDAFECAEEAPAEPIDIFYAEVIEEPVCGTAATSGGGNGESVETGNGDAGVASDEPAEDYFDEPPILSTAGWREPPGPQRRNVAGRSTCQCSTDEHHRPVPTPSASAWRNH